MLRTVIKKTPLSASKPTKEVNMTISPNPDSSTPLTEWGIAWQEFENKYFLTSEACLSNTLLDNGIRVGIPPTEEV